jgi:hypothetical protein
MLMRFAGLILLALVFLSISCTGTKIPDRAEDLQGKRNVDATPQWPCPGGTFDGSNLTNSKCPTNPVLLWEAELSGADCTPPLITHGGYVYTGTSDGLKSFSPTGEENWTKPFKTHIEAPPALDTRSQVIIPYGDIVSLVNGRGQTIKSESISKNATHHPVLDESGMTHIYCMEPIDISELAPGMPDNVPEGTTFKGHIYSFKYGLSDMKHIETGILNCPLRAFDDGIIYGPKIFDRWRPEQPDDPYVSKTALHTPRGTDELLITEVEHGIVGMFTDSDGIIHFFAHREHLPFPEERNAPLNEDGYVYRVILYSYNPKTNDLVKEHWPWMTPEEAVQGTYQEFRQHFNRVRFAYNAAGRVAYANAFVEHEEIEHECDHAPGDNVREEVREFVKGCRHMIMTEDGKILGGTDSIRCFDVVENKIIWEVEGDPSTIALSDNGLLLCLERYPDEGKCILKCYRDEK